MRTRVIGALITLAIAAVWFVLLVIVKSCNGLP